jgi:chromate transporter
MIYLILFWTFFKIGLFTIGGGYAMIPLIRQAVVEEHAWMDETQFTDFVGISESTPGPFAVNISTFSGVQAAHQTGAHPFFASICSTLGVILPSILIILMIAGMFHLLLRHWSVRAALQGARPAVIGLLAAATCFLAMNTFHLSAQLEGIQLGSIGVAVGCYLFAQWAKCGALWLILFGGALGLLAHTFGLSL